MVLLIYFLILFFCWWWEQFSLRAHRCRSRQSWHVSCQIWLGSVRTSASSSPFISPHCTWHMTLTRHHHPPAHVHMHMHTHLRIRTHTHMAQVRVVLCIRMLMERNMFIQRVNHNNKTKATRLSTISKQVRIFYFKILIKRIFKPLRYNFLVSILKKIFLFFFDNNYCSFS